VFFCYSPKAFFQFSISEILFRLLLFSEAPKPIASPVPDAWYPTLSALMLAIGLIVTASFFM
jgi:hypothetical protein